MSENIDLEMTTIDWLQAENMALGVVMNDLKAENAALRAALQRIYDEVEVFPISGPAMRLVCILLDKTITYPEEEK
jgi:hypothetical protein